MLRKLFLCAIVATTTVTDLAALPTADTTPPESPDRCYQVLVLRGEEGWQVHGTYRSHAEARREAIRLWREGYRVAIREF